MYGYGKYTIIIIIIIKIWGKFIFDWTIMGGAMIIPPSPKTKQNKKFFQDRPNYF